MLLENRVALITGGARGIGKAIARMYAKEGADIVIVDVDIDVAKQTATEIEKDFGRKTLALKVDVSKKSEVDDMVKKTVDKFGKIDILVNNAGGNKPTPFFEFTEELWDEIIDVNLKGTFLCTQAVAREMVKKHYGKIINISSCSGIHPNPGETAYGPAKSGVLALTRDNAFELGIHGIYVNAILPGMTDTELTRRVLLNAETEPIWAGKTALKKIAQPEDQANAALFLASSMSDHVTGEGIIVSGGEVMRQ